MGVYEGSLFTCEELKAYWVSSSKALGYRTSSNSDSGELHLYIYIHCNLGCAPSETIKIYIIIYH